MNATAAAPTKLTTTTTHKAKKPQLSEVRIEPAGNGHTVHVRHHGDYMEPGPAPKPKVFEKAHGHEMLKHVARKLGIKVSINPRTEAEPGDEAEE